MTAPQMMAACPKYDEDSGGCNGKYSGKCTHSEIHKYSGPNDCDHGGEDCPACTPLPAEPPAPQSRPSAEERIERELTGEEVLALQARGFVNSMPPLHPAIIRVIEQQDAELDDLRSVDAGHLSRIDGLKTRVEELTSENAALRAELATVYETARALDDHREKIEERYMEAHDQAEALAEQLGVDATCPVAEGSCGNLRRALELNKALDRECSSLRAEVERLEGANESYYVDANAQQRLAIKMQARAEAAEARVKELESLIGSEYRKRLDFIMAALIGSGCMDFNRLWSEWIPVANGVLAAIDAHCERAGK